MMLKLTNNPFTIALTALLHPSQYVAFLQAGRRNWRWAALAAGLWAGVGIALVTLIFGQVVPLGLNGLIGALIVAPLLGVAIAGLMMIVSSGILPTPVMAAFWLTRCTIAITPVLAIGLGFGMSRAAERLPAPQIEALVLLLLLLIGGWIGGALTVVLALSHARQEAPGVRVTLGIGCVIIAVLIWIAPGWQATQGLLLAPVCAGLALGMFRPFAWLWQAPLSLGLAIAVRLGIRAERIASFHPALIDELGILPLPGLAYLLARTIATDLDSGTDLLLTVADHPGQHATACRTINRIIRTGSIAHACLFRLSVHPQGYLLLENLARTQQAHPLLITYATLATVDDQGAWGVTLQPLPGILQPYTTLPGGQACSSLVATGAAVLGATSITAAITELTSIPIPSGVVPDPLWNTITELLAWAQIDAEKLEGLIEWQATIGTVLEEIDGWPAHLLAAITEQLEFLMQIDTQDTV